jgi:MYXO-CTERM domain-containing protein
MADGDKLNISGGACGCSAGLSPQGGAAALALLGLLGVRRRRS